MDGSDDYFTDDLILDEETLAILDEQERKFNSQTSPASQPPATKRQRTSYGWTPGIGNQSHILDDQEDLPEVSIRDDGSYSVQDSQPVQPASDRRKPTSTRPAYASSLQTHNATYPPIQLGTNESNVYHTPLQRPQAFAPASHHNDKISYNLQEQMKELQRKLEQMKEESLKMQSDLKAAIDARLTREGEVAVLRKNMAKTALDHANQIERLKALKEETDAKQVRMQKEMKEEIERIKTQFIFKQQEVEASLRKPQSVPHSKLASREWPSSPVQTLPQRRRNERAAASSSNFQEQTPMRPFHKNMKAHAREVPRSPSPEKRRNVTLPGFKNAFVTSTSSPSPSRSQRSGTNMPVREDFSSSQRQASASSPERYIGDVFSAPAMDDRLMQGLQNAPNDVDRDGDVEMEEISKPSPSHIQADMIESFDWTAELIRILLTHTWSSFSTPTLQMVIGIAYKASLPPEVVAEHSLNGSRIYDLLAMATKNADLGVTSRHLSNHLLSMIPVLKMPDSLLPLAALLNLMTSLVLSLPVFATALLALTTSESKRPRLFIQLCDIFRYLFLQPSHGGEGDALGKEAIVLLETLSFNCTEDSLNLLSGIASNIDIWMVLFEDVRPAWIRLHAARLLVLLASYPALCKSFLHRQDHRQEGSAEPAKFPLAEKLCTFLISEDNDYTKDHEFKSYVLTFFALMSISSPDMHAILLSSTSLVPSLIIYLTKLTNPLWEDDEELTNGPPERIASAISMLNRTLFLLHHLALAASPTFNLRHKLHYSNSRPFSGVNHKFMVTLGRLSFADSPDWIDAQSRSDLEGVVEMAREVLELVVDGPESDSIWQAYQFTSHNDMEEDEGTMEAELLGN